MTAFVLFRVWGVGDQVASRPKPLSNLSPPRFVSKSDAFLGKARRSPDRCFL